MEPDDSIDAMDPTGGLAETDMEAPGDPADPGSPAWEATDAESAAEVYAEYCFSHRDGWEDRWPLKFRVRAEDGTEQDFEVELEMEPRFSARSVA